MKTRRRFTSNAELPRRIRRERRRIVKALGPLLLSAYSLAERLKHLEQGKPR